MASPVGSVEGEQFDGFVPSGGLAAFLEGQDVLPVAALANFHDGLAGVEGVGDQADGQFGELLFGPLAQALEALEFTVLLLGLRVVQIHLLVHEWEQCAFRSDDGELENITVANAVGGRFTACWEALAALFLNTAIDQQDIRGQTAGRHQRGGAPAGPETSTAGFGRPAPGPRDWRGGRRYPNRGRGGGPQSADPRKSGRTRRPYSKPPLRIGAAGRSRCASPGGRGRWR